MNFKLFHIARIGLVFTFIFVFFLQNNYAQFAPKEQVLEIFPIGKDSFYFQNESKIPLTIKIEGRAPFQLFYMEVSDKIDIREIDKKSRVEISFDEATYGRIKEVFEKLNDLMKPKVVQKMEKGKLKTKIVPPEYQDIIDELIRNELDFLIYTDNIPFAEYIPSPKTYANISRYERFIDDAYLSPHKYPKVFKKNGILFRKIKRSRFYRPHTSFIAIEPIGRSKKTALSPNWSEDKVESKIGLSIAISPQMNLVNNHFRSKLYLTGFKYHHNLDFSANDTPVYLNPNYAVDKEITNLDLLQMSSDFTMRLELVEHSLGLKWRMMNRNNSAFFDFELGSYFKRESNIYFKTEYYPENIDIDTDYIRSTDSFTQKAKFGTEPYFTTSVNIPFAPLFPKRTKDAAYSIAIRGVYFSIGGTISYYNPRFIDDFIIQYNEQSLIPITKAFPFKIAGDLGFTLTLF